MERLDVDNDDVDDEVFTQPETSIELPDVPITGTQNLEEIRADKERCDFIATIRTNTDFTGRVDPKICRHLSRDEKGYFYYNNKRVSTGRRQGGLLLSIKSLQRNYDTREFLRLAGYKQAPEQKLELEREMQTVNPEQAESIKSKIASFKITEDWAKKRKGKSNSRVAKYSRRNRKTEIARKNTDMQSIGNSG